MFPNLNINVRNVFAVPLKWYIHKCHVKLLFSSHEVDDLEPTTGDSVSDARAALTMLGYSLPEDEW